MLKDRKNLETALIKQFSEIDRSGKSRNINKQRSEWVEKLQECYAIPATIGSDIVSRRKDLSEYNDFILFAVTEVVSPHLIKTYFTSREIQIYSESKFKEHKIEFPLELSVLKVAKDQFIGATTVQFLMELRAARLINYNADTQRALEIITANGMEIYRPSVNKAAVNAIAESFRTHAYIPNTISLNINTIDEDQEWEYDEEAHILTIKKIQAFDIFDGYHRYLAMGRIFDQDNSFDYPMELRITTFPTSKAKHFIYQEDQKTKMAKIVSDAYNQNSIGNRIVDMLNIDSACYLSGMINLRGGIIDASLMGNAINSIYFEKKVNHNDRKTMIIHSKVIKDGLNAFVAEYPEYLDHKWDITTICIVVCGIALKITPNKINEVIHTLPAEIRKKLYYSGTIVKKGVTSLKEVMNNV